MELKIYSPSEDGFVKAIEWNHEEIKEEVAEKARYYTNLVYTDDQIKVAKADRAKLNKFVLALDEKRKEIKKQCLAPYKDFEEKVKEITAIVGEPIKMIDQQIKGYEEQKKEEKLEQIQAYWESVAAPDHPLTLQHVMNPKWLNASVSMKSIQDEINERIKRYADDIATLRNLPEFSFEAVEVYQDTLDLAKAIQEGKRLSDIQRRKKEFEAEQQRIKSEMEIEKQEELAAVNVGVEETAEEVERAAEKSAAVAEKQWVSFKALLSIEDAAALKEFFISRNIPFDAI